MTPRNKTGHPSLVIKQVFFWGQIRKENKKDTHVTAHKAQTRICIDAVRC